MTDFRALCAELVDCLEKANWPLRHKTVFGICLDNARAALAQPELQGKSCPGCEGTPAASNSPCAVCGQLAQPEPQGPTDEELVELFNENDWNYVSPETFIDIARTVLEGWGRTAIEPVPVTERLPGPEDCTTNPRTGQGQWCWGWVQHDEPPYSGRWRMMRKEWLAGEALAWLPAHALPVPQQEAE